MKLDPLYQMRVDALGRSRTGTGNTSEFGPTQPKFGLQALPKEEWSLFGVKPPDEASQTEREIKVMLAKLKLGESLKSQEAEKLAAPATIENAVTGYTGPKGEIVPGLDLSTPQGLRSFMANLAADRNIPKSAVQLRAREEVQRRRPMPSAEILAQYPQLRKEAEAAQQRTERVDWQQKDWTRRPWDAFAAGKQAFQERLQAAYARLLMDLIARGS